MLRSSLGYLIFAIIARMLCGNHLKSLLQWQYMLLPSNCLNWKIYCDDHSSLSSTTAVQCEFHIHFTAREYMKSTNRPRSQCVASQLSWSSIAPVSRKVTCSNPVEALIFFRLLPSNYLNWKIYCFFSTSRLQ